MKGQLSIRSITRSRRRLFILLTCSVLALLIGVYAFWSFRTWTDYKVGYERWHQQLQSHVNSSFELPSTNTKERQQKITTLKAITTDINTTEGKLCRVHPVISWQHLIPDLKAREAKCHELLSSASTFGVKLQSAIAYLDADQSLTRVFDTALKTQPSTEGMWESQAAVWHEAGESVRKLVVPAEFKAVQAKSTTVIQDIETAWQSVTTANKAQDKAKYLEAQTKLANSYGSITQVGVFSDEQFTLLVNMIQQEYAKAFSISV